MPHTSRHTAVLASRVLALILAGVALLEGPQAVAQPTSDVGDSAAAEPDDTTRQLLRQGYTALKRADLEGARAAFAAAWAHRQHVAVALSLAEVETRLGRFVDAAEHWQYLLANLPPDHADQHDAAREQLKACKTHIGTVTVSGLPTAATLFINNAAVAEGPTSREFYVEPGTHSIYAVKDGRRSTERTFHAASGSRFSFDLTIPTDPAAPGRQQFTAAALPATTTAGPRDAAPPGTSLRMPVLLSTAALSLVSAGAGTYFTIRSNNAHDEANAALNIAIAKADPGTAIDSACYGPDRAVECKIARDKRGDADHFRGYAVGAFISAGAFAAATAVTFVLWPAAERRETRTASNFVIVPTLAPEVGGVTIVGRF